jgi:NitT/TauT family transport system permease protein
MSGKFAICLGPRPMPDDNQSTTSHKRFAASGRSLIIGVVSVTVAVAGWEVAVHALSIPSYVLPAPYDVWRALVAGLIADPTSRASFWYQLADTMNATLWGFAAGSVIGIALAAIMAEFRVVEELLFPYVVGFQSVPKVAIAPLYVIWFGYQIESKIAMAATLALFPVLLNSLEGFVTVERERLELMTSLSASRWQTFRMIKVPSSLPFIFAGLNLGIVYAFLGAIVSEFIGAQRGMGVIITQLQSVSDTAGVFACLILLGVAGYILIAIMRAIQRRFVFWAGSGHIADAP